jgi:hypothetical protein
MNDNALKKKSSIKIKETYCGALPKNVGFPRGMDGYIMPKEEYYAELKKNGYKVEFTKHGIFISK